MVFIYSKSTGAWKTLFLLHLGNILFSLTFLECFLSLVFSFIQYIEFQRLIFVFSQRRHFLTTIKPQFIYCLLLQSSPEAFFFLQEVCFTRHRIFSLLHSHQICVILFTFDLIEGACRRLGSDTNISWLLSTASLQCDAQTLPKNNFLLKNPQKPTNTN